MKASEKEKAGIRKFVCGQLRDEPDLSTLTLGILKRRYLARVRCESLSPEAKTFMKRVVEEELVKMQENDDNNDDNGSELETTKPQNKRKREKENDEVKSGRKDHDDESRAKKSRRQLSSSSVTHSCGSIIKVDSTPDSSCPHVEVSLGKTLTQIAPDESEDCKTGSEESEGEEPIKSESEDEKQEVKKPQQKTDRISKQQKNNEDLTDDEINESEKKGNGSNCDSSEEIVIKGANAAKNEETRSSSTSKGKKTPQSDEENEKDSKSEKSDKINSSDSSDDSKKEEKVLVERKDNIPDSDSSSLPSLDEEQHSGKENAKDDEKKKTVKRDEKKEKSARGQKQESQKAVVRLKRYISLCGLRPNYKKLLGGCRSVRSQVAVLKKELEDLGVSGQPSIKKCKTVRMKREETEELADLDVSNIIATKGRPKRRASLAWQEQQDPPSSTYLRTLDSGSASDEENNTHRGRRRATDWANLQGIISDDANDSN